MMGAGPLVPCAVSSPCLCADGESSVAAKLGGSGQGNCSLAISGNVEVSAHTEIQNQGPSCRTWRVPTFCYCCTNHRGVC